MKLAHEAMSVEALHGDGQIKNDWVRSPVKV